MSDSPLWIAEADVVALMDMPAAIGALEAGLVAEARRTASNMTKTHVEWQTTGGHATLHAIGAVFTESGIAGTKTWVHSPGGATPLLILFNADNGRVNAIIEAFALGQRSGWPVTAPTSSR
jgi:alanine dehydrogenase